MSILIVFLTIIFIMIPLIKFKELKKYENLLISIIFILFFFYSACRGEYVGIDTYAINEIFRNISKFGIFSDVRNTELEIGYKFLNYILSRIIDHPQIIIIFGSFIITISFYLLIKKYSRNKFFSTLIFISTISMVTLNVSRQFIALSFVILAFIKFDENKSWFFLFAIIAATMHYSSIILLPFLIFTFKSFTLTKNKFKILSLLIASTLLFYDKLISLFIKILPQYNRFLESDYFSSEVDISVYNVILFISVDILILFLLYKPTLDMKVEVVEKKQELKLENYLFLCLLFLTYQILYFISRKLLIAVRLTYFFSFSLILIIPNTLDYLEQKYKNLVLLRLIRFLYIIYFYWFGIKYLINDPHGVLPYEFFWG